AAAGDGDVATLDGLLQVDQRREAGPAGLAVVAGGALLGDADGQQGVLAGAASLGVFADPRNTPEVLSLLELTLPDPTFGPGAVVVRHAQLLVQGAAVDHRLLRLTPGRAEPASGPRPRSSPARPGPPPLPARRLRRWRLLHGRRGCAGRPPA